MKMRQSKYLNFKHRATESEAKGRYRLIENMFSRSNPLTSEDLRRHNASDVSLEELFLQLAHRKEDMIVE
ncbi:hypothetical protein DPMN_097724 [Dreissena polymorpha]|uniref:Uncharacterized protein n=1 Tax=Dreissena polymorpha TaxID=45954 RepID=A0A9D4LDD7_DREPO|nr:hypothetical protein DPMN_097724 [Dreissena polymorpha]